MTILSKLLGSDKPETSLELERKLAELADQESTTKRTLTEIDVQRDACLLAGDYKKMDADADRRKEAERDLERIAIIRAELQQRLIAAREIERAKLIADLRSESLTRKVFNDIHTLQAVW